MASSSRWLPRAMESSPVWFQAASAWYDIDIQVWCLRPVLAIAGLGWLGDVNESNKEQGAWEQKKLEKWA